MRRRSGPLAQGLSQGWSRAELGPQSPRVQPGQDPLAGQVSVVGRIQFLVVVGLRVLYWC